MLMQVQRDRCSELKKKGEKGVCMFWWRGVLVSCRLRNKMTDPFDASEPESENLHRNYK